MQKTFHLYIIVLFIFAVLLCSCSKKITQPIMDSNNDIALMEERDLQSQINLNFKINKDSVNQSFNKILDSLFVNEIDVSAMGFEVGILNLQNAELEIQGKQVLTNLPLQINLTRKTFITNIDIEASLQVTFITSLEVDSVWQIATKTTLEDYKWLKKPELSLGSINIGVKPLADIIIQQSKGNLEGQIDSIMSEQFQLKDQVERMMFFLEDPILIDSTLSKWLKFEPDSILLSEINNGKSYYSGNIAILGTPLILNKLPKNSTKKSKNSLPNLKWIDPNAGNSKLKMSFDITLDKLTQYANNNFANKPLSNDGREIILSNISITKDYDELKCSANAKGDFNGKVLITGKPQFDHSKQTLFTKDINIDFQTDNVFHKAGIWLAKGKIKSKLSSMFNFSLKDKIEDIQSTINSQVEKLSKEYDVDIKCDINGIDFEQFIITEESINVFFGIDLYLESTINSLQNLQNVPN